jgi:serine/threonine-protein kinase RsbW
VHVRLTLHLPRDPGTVAMIRRVLDSALALLAVAEDCRDDITLALSEACTNAINHAQVGDAYDVVVAVHADVCVFEVIDTGVGLRPDHLDRGSLPDLVSEHGRGLVVIRTCTDSLELRPVHPHGLAVRMSKTLTRSRRRRRAAGGRRCHVRPRRCRVRRVAASGRDRLA